MIVILLAAWAGFVPSWADEPAAHAVTSADTVWLSELPEQDVHVGFGQFGKQGRAGFENVPIAVNYVPATHGLGMHPPDAAVSYQLDKEYRTFQSTVTINDSAPGGAHSPIFFHVELDGKPVWESRGIKEHNVWQPVYLDVTGVNRLTLRVTLDPKRGTNSSQAHAVWLDPSVSTAPPDAELLKLQAASHYKEYDEAAGYTRHVRELLKEDKFADLEQLLKEARAKRDHLADFPRLWWFYTALYEPFVDSESGHVEQIDRAADWRKKFPKSMAPRLLAAVNWTSIGIDGGGATNGVDALAKAGDIFEGARSLEMKDAEFDARLINLLKWQHAPRHEIDTLLDDAIKIDPTYYPIYQIVAHYVLMNGSANRGMQKLAESLRERIGGDAGQIAYATVALHWAAYEGTAILNHEFAYADLKPALLAECHAFPALWPYLQKTAWLASVSDDPTTAREMFKQIPSQCRDSQTWESNDCFANARRWSAAGFPRGQEIKTLHGNGEIPLHLAVSSNGSSLATGDFNGDVCFWDLQKSAVVDVWRAPQGVYCLVFDPTKPRLLVSSSQFQGPSSLWLYDFVAGAEPMRLKGHTQGVVDAMFSADGKRVVTASLDKTARIWSLDSPIHSISIPHPEEVCSISISSDGSKLCTASIHGGLFLWDGRTGKPLGAPLVAAGKGVESPLVRFLPDGERFVLAGRDGALQLWDVKSRKSSTSATGESKIWSAVVSPDGKVLAIGRQSGDIELYDPTSLRKIHTCQGHWGPIADLAFAPDGQTFFSASRDTMVKLWDMRPYDRPALPASSKP